MSMNNKSKKRILAINIALVALLFLLVSLNKSYVRPEFGHVQVVGFLAGIIPNFLAAFIISAVFVNAVIIREPRYQRLIVYSSSILVFAILTVEEIQPMWGASTLYDPLDILASGIGSLLAIFVYEMIVLYINKRRNVSSI
jgi:F0F1-type ATP synthase assembly protein I